MRDMAAVAQHLRTVWQARRHFLKMAAVERAVIEPALDRLCEELSERVDPASRRANDGQGPDTSGGPQN